MVFFLPSTCSLDSLAFAGGIHCEAPPVAPVAVVTCACVEAGSWGTSCGVVGGACVPGWGRFKPGVAVDDGPGCAVLTLSNPRLSPLSSSPEKFNKTKELRLQTTIDFPIHLS